MKLIIDIPKDVYKDILKHSTEIQAEGYIIANAVLNGTPLDSVIAEIRAEIDDAKPPKNQMSFFRDGINCALQIIDKYKAESEG